MADLGLGHRPLSDVGPEGRGWVVEEEAHVKRCEAFICALVHVSPVVQKQVDNVNVTVNLEGEGRSHKDSRLPQPGVRRAPNAHMETASPSEAPGRPEL